MRKPSTCHSDRPHQAKGLCKPCYQHQHYLKNHERELAKSREYRLANAEKKRLQGKVYARTAKSRYIQVVKAARTRDLECTLAFDEYCELIKKPCYYCGGVLPEAGGGLDRIDSELGYTSENVRPSCFQCNLAKSDYSESEFEEWALQLFGSRWFILLLSRQKAVA